ncbi:LuxR C-terminal-related transcriptional regulator [Geodermatophilus sp. SYSU D01036]
MRSGDAVRVLVLDEQEVVRRGVSQVLGDDPALTVVAEATSVAEAVARGLAVRPDVAVVGMRLPDGSGAEAWARLRAGVPGLRCLVLSAYCDPATVQAAVRLGVAGYLVKHVRGPALVAAVHRVAAGGTVFHPEVTAAVSDPTDRRPHPLDRLTPRERELLRLLGEGLTNRQIGERLGLTEKTVKNYASNLLGKLGLQRRTQAAVLATELRDRLTAIPHAGGAGDRRPRGRRPTGTAQPGRASGAVAAPDASGSGSPPARRPAGRS